MGDFTLEDGINMLNDIRDMLTSSVSDGISKVEKFVSLLGKQADYDKESISRYFYIKFNDTLTILTFDEKEGLLRFEECYDELMRFASPEKNNTKCGSCP